MTTAEYNLCVEEYADRLYSFILKNLKNADSSSDIVQETFTRLWIKVDHVQFQKVKSYLFTTAYHTMIDHIRKSKRIADFEEAGAIDPAHDDQYSDLKEVLDNVLDTLPASQRSVILLRDYEGYSYQEIAEITGLSESQVKVYIYRGRMALKKAIGSVETLI
ncbi:MAG: sigma-70 family RNA polymerase sigma factor [Bacteroidetes bacterium]|jgi:RNA polymerase sigma-70 factor (ECF subfamily)|nr:sigma-70 family RNA polymerase sigma factor [Bacteroidota bacterium]